MADNSAGEFSISELIGQVQSVMKGLNRLNIVVAGKTGAGKSTLINNIFTEHLAATGIGMPVTDHVCKLEKQGVPLSIFDTRGLELGAEAQAESFMEIKDIIAKGAMSPDVSEKIHCLLYCINTAANRIETSEIGFLKEFTHGGNILQVPVIVVLTQSFSKKNAEQLKAVIEWENLPIAQVVPLLAEPYELDEDNVIPSYGLDVLVEVMKQVLPEELEMTLQNVQIASIKEKVKLADKYVLAAASSAAAAAAVPLPVADSVALIPIQVGMIAKITAVFGIDVSANIVAGIISSLAGSAGATIAGRELAANLLKLIPGGGTAAGMAVSAVSASAMTLSLGKAYIKLMEKVAEGKIDPRNIGNKEFTDELREMMKED